jgi:hypothetical protein
MSIAESGIDWLKAVIMAPFVAVLFGAVTKVMATLYQSMHINGNGELAQAQDSVFYTVMLSLDLLELASSLNTWVLFAGFLFAILAVYQTWIQ